MSQTCPSCGTEAEGRFCAACGAAVNATCRECRNPLPAGARFCNQCGVAVAAPSTPAAASGGRAGALPWAVAGAAVAALAAVAILPRLGGDDAGAPAPAAAMAPAAGGLDPSSVDLAGMTPRQRADALFNRVMQANAGGDTTRLGFFTEMAVQAYGMVPERDADLHYHVAELLRLKGDVDGMAARADTILAADPDHLFGLYTAAQAAQLRGDDDGARVLFQRFVDGYAEQVARDLPEYRDHVQGLPALRAEAEAALADG